MILKRKHEEDSDKSPHKKHKHDDSDFSVIHASTVVSIPPVFTSNPKEGVLEMLDSMVMRYIPPLEGVVLTHSNLRFLQSTALLQYDCPYAKCNVSFDATVWSPRVGQKLAGKVILCSPDHISLLIHRTFNVSIPRHHIPTEKCRFEWGPAENDPEFGVGAANLSIEKTDGEDTTMAGGEYALAGDADAVSGNRGAEAEAEVDVAAEENLGSWVDEETGKPLGPVLEFTVIGLTIANQMLSLIGSLQPDPFSPLHVPPAAVSENDAERRRDQDTSIEEAEDASEVEDVVDPHLDNEDDLNDEEDGAATKAKLGKQTVKQKELVKEKVEEVKETFAKSKTKKGKEKKVKTKEDKEDHGTKRKHKEKNKTESSEFINDSESESPVKEQSSAKRKIVDNANTKPKKKAKT